MVTEPKNLGKFYNITNTTKVVRHTLHCAVMYAMIGMRYRTKTKDERPVSKPTCRQLHSSIEFNSSSNNMGMQNFFQSVEDGRQV